MSDLERMVSDAIGKAAERWFSRQADELPAKIIVEQAVCIANLRRVLNNVLAADDSPMPEMMEAALRKAREVLGDE